ncbi:MAG TPA: zinc ABC transporter ATP-binding protein ZnuC [Thiotrichaceae bacterium]|nr:zinc ABC transporter ATP-binding protein ZnuC [Thiotrichaceae bacterium]
MSDTLTSLENISLSIAHKKILDNVSLTVKLGQIVTIIGPNGAGKTSLLNVLLGFSKPQQGNVFQAEGLTIGYVPQQVSIDSHLPLTVTDFILLAKGSTASQLSQVTNEVSISHLLQHPIQSLSGGEFQRVLLARALIRQPQLLVLDEPAQGVDINGQAQLYQLLEDLVDKHRFGVLMVSHDLHLVMAKSDQVLCLNQHICCSGSPEDINNHPEYLKLFNATEAGSISIYTHHHDHEHSLDGDICPLRQQGKPCPQGHDHG